MELESKGVLARCFMRQRGRRIRRPTAQSGLRSASRRAAPPALCLLALGRLENPVHGTGGLVYGMGKMTDTVHELSDLVYGIGEMTDAVHGLRGLVYGMG